MELKELLGEELYAQVEAKITEANAEKEDKLQHIRYADLSEGNYVGKKKYETLEVEKGNLETQIATLNKTFALTQALQKAGVLDAEYLIYKAGGIDKFDFNKEGKPIGVDDILAPYKADETMAHLFKQEPKKPPYNPKGGNGGSGVNPFAKETFNLTKQGEMLKNNPEQAKAMAVAAGVTL